MSTQTNVQRTAGQSVYVDTFFRELSPTWLDYVAALHGFAAPALDCPFTYMELGCGHGQSTIVNAAAFPHAEFHACDIHPAHIDTARRYAAALDVDNVHLHEASFDALLERDLPHFDFIVLHGVYSWVDAGARAAIRELARRKLRRNGIVYASYNCLPGWSVEMPVRRLINELSMSSRGGAPDRAANALLTLRRLGNSKLGYFTANPGALAATASYATRPSEYLAHEFLADSWQPFYSVDVEQEMRDANLEYVGSATLADNHRALIMTDEAAAAIALLDTPRQRRLAEDFAVNRYFRRDVFASSRSDRDRSRLERVVVGTLVSPGTMASTVRVPRGIVTFRSAFIEELGRVLAPGSSTFGDIARALRGTARDAGEIVRNLTFLIAAGVLQPFAKIHRVDDPPRTNAIAAKVLRDIAQSGRRRALPSEVLGNGVEIGPADSVQKLNPMLARLGLSV
jgi:Predicted methyltransferase regulatory domain/Methyltransferase domain